MYTPASTNLTPNAVQIMSGMDSSMDDEFFVPVMQVLRLKKLDDGDGEKWLVALSDGQHFLHGECAPESLNKLIHHHIIAKNAIIEVRQFFMSTRGDRKICYLLDAQQSAPNPGAVFGSPTDIRSLVKPEGGKKGKIKSSRESVMVESMALGKLEQKGRMNDGFFATRSEPRWHNAYRDFRHRQAMLGNIERMLKEAETMQNGTIPSHRQSELTILAKQWELKLYQQAHSFDAYIDQSTFVERMNRLSRTTNSEGEITLMHHNRLHLLRHAMMCKDENCTVTPFCRDMDDVVKHMETCKEGERCQVPFCVTMQRLLVHSKQCRDPVCKICAPSIKVPGCTLCEGGGKSQTKMRQDYLLTMMHASMCHHEEEGQCLISPFCFDLKKVWVHRIYCNDLSCRYPFCASSRPHFDHYNACHDNTCQICPPVRDTKAKHGIEKLTVDASLKNNKAAMGAQSIVSLTYAAKLDEKAQPARPSSAGNPSQDPQVAAVCQSSDPNIDAQQVAIYAAIQKKEKRKIIATSSTDQNPANNSFDAFMAGDPMSDIDSAMEEFSIHSSMCSSSGCSSRNSAKPATIDDLQVREYERLSRAHQQRQRSGSSCSSRIAGKPACSSSVGSEDKKLPANKDGSKNFSNDEAGYYLATTYSTRNNSKNVTCMHCQIGLFIPPAASMLCCQQCNGKSFTTGGSVSS